MKKIKKSVEEGDKIKEHFKNHLDDLGKNNSK